MASTVAHPVAHPGRVSLATRAIGFVIMACASGLILMGCAIVVFLQAIGPTQ